MELIRNMVNIKKSKYNKTIYIKREEKKIDLKLVKQEFQQIIQQQPFLSTDKQIEFYDIQNITGEVFFYCNCFFISLIKKGYISNCQRQKKTWLSCLNRYIIQRSWIILRSRRCIQIYIIYR
ncbi:hypothetical protein IMG5_098470 [Ichthyophthirius multifiliis]|uniref:Uncharacterized protein n=1 Tax=Ichthyophthirius multifiliis TaxID=5932 RepID=G0QRY1_ICHMU|nr:hypothetical protein IMG5_098470 [Ichthyophthirius multifiliis]EGR32011.1 hypothetical protein IMG5_098470 [Ichthyophthirius multifiliis]|eukprot:XP_004035497.1 hypothetical protein IMG5_098470 [Ichthyophthirius multifiliis]